MAEAAKFLFDKDFDADEPAPAPQPDAGAEPEAPAEPPPPEPSYFEEDLAAARAEARDAGYREGFETGRERGRGEAETAATEAAAQALDRVAAGLDRLLQEQPAAEARRDREALEVATTLVRKLFPALHRNHGLAEIETLLGETLSRLRQEPQVVVRVSEELKEPLRERLDPVTAKSGFDGKVSLVGEPGLAAGDVRVEWSEGGTEHSTADVWRSVDAAIAEVFGAAVAPGDENAAAPTAAETRNGNGASPHAGAGHDGTTGSADGAATDGAADAPARGPGLDETKAATADGARAAPDGAAATPTA